VNKKAHLKAAHPKIARMMYGKFSNKIFPYNLINRNAYGFVISARHPSTRDFWMANFTEGYEIIARNIRYFICRGAEL
jgi:hypothetical protein